MAGRGGQEQVTDDMADVDVSLKEPLRIEWVLRPEDLRDPLNPDLNMAGGPFTEPTMSEEG